MVIFFHASSFPSTRNKLSQILLLERTSAALSLQLRFKDLSKAGSRYSVGIPALVFVQPYPVVSQQCWFS